MRSSIGRNESIRNKVIESREENGFMLGHLASKTSIPLSTISSWRTGKMNFMDEKLDLIEKFLKGYEKS